MAVSMKLEGDKLVVTFDVSKKAIEDAPPSSTGKTKLVASTRGYTGISTPHGIVKVMLNATA